MSPLRQRMAEEMRRRNYSTETQRAYVHYIAEYAKYFGVSPDQLGPEAIREYQLHLADERKMSPESINCFTSAAKFLYLRRESCHGVTHISSARVCPRGFRFPLRSVPFSAVSANISCRKSTIAVSPPLSISIPAQPSRLIFTVAAPIHPFGHDVAEKSGTRDLTKNHGRPCRRGEYAAC
jgi:hypothetical protein